MSAPDRAAVEAAVAHVRQIHTWRAERGYATHDYGDDAIATLLDEVKRLGRVEQEQKASAGFVAVWHDTALVQHEVDEIRCQSCRAYMAGPLPLPSPVTLADLVALAARHECLPRMDAADLAARDEREA